MVQYATNFFKSLCPHILIEASIAPIKAIVLKKTVSISHEIKLLNLKKENNAVFTKKPLK